MIGIVLASHGDFSKGMHSAAKLFFGEDIEQLTDIGLYAGEGPECFHEKLVKAIKEVDSGEGVIILTDLLGGSPCNQTYDLQSDKVTVLSGVNFTLFLELLGLRMSGEIDVEQLIQTGKDGIVNVNKKISESMNDDAFF